MLTISTASHKGGCGKTTTAVNLAGAAHSIGADILFVDLDSQGSASAHLGALDTDIGSGDLLAVRGAGASFEEAVCSLADMEESFLKGAGSGKTRFDLLPGTMELAVVESQLSGKARTNRLRSLLEDVQSNYDLCVIDCGKGIDILTINGLMASDAVLCPINCKRIALKGIREFHDTVDVVRENGNDVDVFYLPTVYNQTRGEKRQGDEVIDVLEEAYGAYPDGRVLPPIRKWNGYDDAFVEGVTAFQKPAPNKGIEDYMHILDIILETEASFSKSSLGRGAHSEREMQAA
jgi:chromosome partitioning protein